MKKILITNDDGFDSVGIRKLIEAIQGLGEIYVVAPALHKSACGHSLTILRPLFKQSIDDDFYKIDDGTPTDCVYLALNDIFANVKPDLVLSGINEGANLGDDITYSGTAGAVMEAVLQGISGIAFSQVLKPYNKQDDFVDWKQTKKYVRAITQKVLKNDPFKDERKFLNVNIPNDEIKGIKVTKLGYKIYSNEAFRHQDPRGREYFWIGLPALEFEYEENSDLGAISDGFVSITPIKMDMTDYGEIPYIKEWLRGKNES
jgi:5'-nucleotidase